MAIAKVVNDFHVIFSEHCSIFYQIFQQHLTLLTSYCSLQCSFPLIDQLVKNLPAMEDTPVRFLGQEYHLQKGQATYSSILRLLCGSAGEESACNVRDLVRSLGWEDPLQKGKAIHSSILAWRIPWTGQSMGSQRVRND